ncbi:prepilin peptidase [Enterobacter sp. A11]|uniref:prepilin peptidase n=1 Tax=Enterobacter TaxID=547 RepID=UPI0004873F89|nr:MULTISPECIES: A24 family peptidase [Enterobacter]HDT2078548.1 prepilin peptidase [Enterobacter roggenkampii]HEG2004730.1 prepilin peptidase [Enterobacter asburiae]MBM1024012.1 prepilin peptidase [Enterobacter sp. E1]MCD2461600.1 A24 family peptidase [Enterobacter cloacae complex sp. 2021EL-01261]MDT9877451.1 A24 family peptidase [Enterobacter cloacae]
MLTTLTFLLIYSSLTAFLVHADIRYGLLPDKFLCPLLWVGLLFQLCIHPDFLPSAVVGAMAGYFGFAVIYWGYRFICRREGMGYGDVKYLSALGAWHGWCVLPTLALLAALMALLSLLVFSLLTSDKEAIKNPLPFGPFLAAAGLCVGWKTLFTLPL